MYDPKYLDQIAALRSVRSQITSLMSASTDGNDLDWAELDRLAKSVDSIKPMLTAVTFSRIGGTRYWPEPNVEVVLFSNQTGVSIYREYFRGEQNTSWIGKSEAIRKSEAVVA